MTLALDATSPEVAPLLTEVAPGARHLRVVPADDAHHHHLWVIRDALHHELGTLEPRFECQDCGSPYS
ncbi:hypothetical protein ABIE44_002032 [Marmoricola sp. OAE513]